MADKELPSFDYFEYEEAESLIDLGLHPTESIDLKGLVDELDGPLGESSSVPMQETALGKLLEALPISTLLIDRSRRILFANQACEKISPDFAKIQGGPFSGLFPDPRDAQQAQSLVEQVFTTRKTQIIEGLLKIENKRIWARAHLRSLKMGADASLLVLIEDLTLEKTQLRMQQKVRQELEKRVEERTGALAKMNEQLQREVGERKRAEAELRKHRGDLEKLVAERSAELKTTIKRLRQEIQERKQAEKSLRSSQQKFDVAFRANPAPVSIASLKDGRFIEVNDSFCRFTGYARDEVVGRKGSELGLWGRSGFEENLLRTLSEKRRIRDVETALRTKSGRARVAVLSAEAIELDGEPHVLTIATDITERKLAEADHERLTAAVEQVEENILITDPDGAIKYANSAFERQTGYKRNEIISMDIGLIRAPGNDKNALAEMTKRVKKGKSWKGRLTNRRKDGSEYTVDTAVSPVLGNSKRFTDLVVVERITSDESPVDRRIPVGGGEESLRLLAQGIAHDFNDIFSAILGYTYLANQRLASDNPVAGELENVTEACSRGRDLVRNILTYSGHVAHEAEPTAVERIVREELKRLRETIPPTIDITEEIDRKAGETMAGETDIRQVLAQLVSNARKAVGARPGTVAVTLTRRDANEDFDRFGSPELTPDSYIHLSVTDTGCGMSRETAERAFEPFFTTWERQKGGGMGLAVARAIVRRCGGDISVESRDGGGAAFHVFFPLLKEAAAQPASGIETTGDELIAVRVLVVDDDPQVAEMEKSVLASLGYDVTACSDPADALDLFRTSSPGFDLIIVDFTMPGMSGVEFTRRALELRPGTPVIMCVDFDDLITRHKAIEAGAGEALVKPLLPDTLSRAVSGILGAETKFIEP